MAFWSLLSPPTARSVWLARRRAGPVAGALAARAALGPQARTGRKLAARRAPLVRRARLLAWQARCQARILAPAMAGAVSTLTRRATPAHSWLHSRWPPQCSVADARRPETGHRSARAIGKAA